MQDNISLETFKKVKLVLDNYVPWAKAVNLEEFISLAYDTMVMNNRTCTLIDLEVAVECVLAEKLEKIDCLVRVSSDDEAISYQVSTFGIDKIFKILENRTITQKIDEYDLFLMWLLYFQILNMEVDKELSTLKDSLEYVFNEHNLDITKYVRKIE